MVYFKKIAYSGKYQDDNAIPQLVGYIMQVYKTEHKLIGAYNIKNYQNPAEDMIAISNYYGKNSRIRLHHFVLSFESYLNNSYDFIFKIGCMVARAFQPMYQIIFAVHEDTKNIHIHFVFNAVSYVNGKKYHGGKTEYKELFRICDNVISKAGLSPLIAVAYHPDQMDIENANE